MKSQSQSSSTSEAIELLKERQQLPIWPHKEAIIKAVQRNSNCVIVSSTGTGKTTQLPQFLLDAGLAKNGTIAITQPRRIAAITVAHRVASEVGCGGVGEGPVGYCVRFEDVSSPERTRLRYMTDGMLLREACLDPGLLRYSVVIVDEAHERSLNTEVLLGVLLNASRKRELSKRPLKIIIMSATIDPNTFVGFLGPTKTRVIYVEGRRFPIKILSAGQPSIDYVADAASTCIQMHKVPVCPADRGFLIFLTGEEEITRCVGLIRRLYRSLVETNKKEATRLPGLCVLPLFAALPQAQQLRALSFVKPGVRKVIVSTNIAETSITIPDIRYVIDCGRAKTLDWDSATGLERLRVSWVSKSQAWQRAGRAGREAAGVCLRLYTDDEYEHRMSLHPPSQLTSASLSGVLLSLLAMGIPTVRHFPWLEPPKQESIDVGLDLLEHLGAISRKVATTNTTTTTCDDAALSVSRPIKLTKMGRLMTAFPLAPRQARALCSADHLGCLVEAITAVCMLYVCPVFYVPQESREDFFEVATRFRHSDGDLASHILVYRAFVKAMGRGEAKNGLTAASTGNRRQWCRENYLNYARLQTAVKVRGQLKNIAKGAGLSNFRTCGVDDLTPLNRAFFEVAFRDQIATLSASRVDSSSKNSPFPFYTRLHQDSTDSKGDSTLLSIHPDSSLYAIAVVARSPPAAILFIEAVDASSADQQQLPTTNQKTRRVLLRHVCPIPPEWFAGNSDQVPGSGVVVVVRKRYHADVETQSDIKLTEIPSKKAKIQSCESVNQPLGSNYMSPQSSVSKSKGQKRREKKRLRRAMEVGGGLT